MAHLYSFWNLGANLFGYDRPETQGEVLFFRGFELFIVSILALEAWNWGRYARTLTALPVPHGLAAYIDLSLLLQHNLPLVTAALLTVLLLLGYLRKGRWAYAVALLLLHMQFTLRFSLGKVEHGTNLLAMTLLGLSLAMLLFPDALHRRRFTLGFTYFFTGLGYFAAGLTKLIGTGPLWSRGTHLWLWMHEKGIDGLANTGVSQLNGLQGFILSHPHLATLLLTLGLLVELAAVLAWWRRFRLPVLLALVGMHLGAYVTLDILFKWSIAELLLLALPWAAWLNRLLERPAVVEGSNA